MDNNFQTSFIPKKPLAEERTQVIQHSSIFSFIATLIFFAALAAAVGVYFYKASLTKNITAMSAELDASRNSFEPSLISTLQQLDRRITNANMLLSNHIVVSPIFEALEADTLKSIQFTKFTYLTPTDTSSPIVVKMSGKARDYASIALQSDQFATNPNIHNSIFSNLALDQKTGMVSFDLTFTIDASLVHFIDNLNPLGDQTGTPQDSSDTTSAAGGTATNTGTTAAVTSGGGTFPSAVNNTVTPAAGTTAGGTGGSVPAQTPTSQTQAQILQNLSNESLGH